MNIKNTNIKCSLIFIVPKILTANITAIEKYMVLPGQALLYKKSQLTIGSLRQDIEKNG